MAVDGVEVQPSNTGINPGKGHHHLLIDINLPRDLSEMLDKDSNHIHMGDGSTCKELELARGKHIVRTLFATGAHVPYNPAITPHPLSLLLSKKFLDTHASPLKRGGMCIPSLKGRQIFTLPY